MNIRGGLFIAISLLSCSPVFAWTKGTCHNSRIASASTGNVAVTAASGDLVVFMIGKLGAASNSISATYPQDNNGTLTAALAYTEVNANSAWNGVGFYYETAAASGTHTISVSFSSNGNFVLFACNYSYTGTASLDVAGSINTGSGTTANSGSITPSQSGDLVIALIGSFSTASVGSWTNSFVEEDSNITAQPSVAWADLNPDTCSGACSATSTAATVSNAAWEGYIVAFKTAAGGCTNKGLTSGGSVAVPTAGTTVVRLKNGSFGTVDCSTGIYFQPTIGNFGAN